MKKDILQIVCAFMGTIATVAGQEAAGAAWIAAAFVILAMPDTPPRGKS